MFLKPALLLVTLSLVFGGRVAANPGTGFAAPAGPPEAIVKTRVFESKPFEIDKIYKSMTGPREVRRVTLGKGEQLMWVLSYNTEIIDTNTGADLSAEYMCHNNLNVGNLNNHRSAIGAPPVRGVPRIFALSQGVMDVDFPDGYALPVRAGEPLILNYQVLNLNPIEKPIEVHYRTSVRYVLDSDLRKPLRPLYQFGIQGLKLVAGEQGYPGLKHADPDVHGESCSVGEVLDVSNQFENPDGNTYTNHWIVEPGREENHTLVSPRLGLKRDVSVHYINVHVHPYAESIELRDLTTGETVYKSRITNHTDRIGIASAETYSSGNGLTLFKDHEYTLISVYQNDSGQRQDAMASMFLYIRDESFERAHAAKTGRAKLSNRTTR
jgi:hypothetical protein